LGVAAFGAKGIIQSPITSCSKRDHSVCQASANSIRKISRSRRCGLLAAKGGGGIAQRGRSLISTIALLLLLFITYISYFKVTNDYCAPVGVQSIPINMSVCMYVGLFVCLSVCSHVSQKQHVQISPNFLYTLPVAVSRSLYDSNAIRYVLPVL